MNVASTNMTNLNNISNLGNAAPTGSNPSNQTSLQPTAASKSNGITFEGLSNVGDLKTLGSDAINELVKLLILNMLLNLIQDVTNSTSSQNNNLHLDTINFLNISMNESQGQSGANAAQQGVSAFQGVQQMGTTPPTGTLLNTTV